MVAASAEQAVIFSLTPGNAGDAPEGRALLEKLKTFGRMELCDILMDKAYEGEATREKAFECGFNPVVPPKNNRCDPWQYDKDAYKKRNQVERLFRRIKRFRRVFTRYDKTDIMYTAFITLALMLDLFKLC